MSHNIGISNLCEKKIVNNVSEYKSRREMVIANDSFVC